MIIKQTFEETILTHLFPNTRIDIFVQVIQADGGTRCASINAVTLALIDAGIPMYDFAVACASGWFDDTPLLDLNHYELSSGSPDFPLAIFPKSDKIIVAQMHSKLPMQHFEMLLQTAVEGCHKIYEILVTYVRDRALNLLDSRGSHF